MQMRPEEQWPVHTCKTSWRAVDRRRSPRIRRLAGVLACAAALVTGVGIVSAAPPDAVETLTRDGNGEDSSDLARVSDTMCALTRAAYEPGPNNGRDVCRIDNVDGIWVLRAEVRSGGSIACQARCWID